jgi:aryl-alcohol dehydrogenase-like predicted oxidoreductase
VRLRPLGKTGLNVTELAVGTFGLSGDGYGPVVHEEAKATLEKALDMGITLFETADAYGAGKMEALLGELTAGLPGITVVTKVGIDRSTVPPKRRFDKEYLEAAIARSAKRLKKDALDVLLLHHPSDDFLLQHTCGALMRDFVQRGLIKHWGCAVTSHDCGQFAISEGAKVVELAYNLTHVRELNRMTGDVMVERTGVLARSVLSYGMLSGTWNKDRKFPEGDHRSERWTREELNERLDRIEEFRFLIRDDIHSLRAAALRFALSSSVVTSVVLGPKNAEQLKELVRDAGAGPRYMSDDDIKEVYRTLERLGVPI